MTFLASRRTARLLRTNSALGGEHTRFDAYLQAGFKEPAATAVLSNYVHAEEQDFQRKRMLEVAEEAFTLAWGHAYMAYQNDLAGDSTAHGHFLALLHAQAPYERHDYRLWLLEQHRRALIERMIYLVKRNTRDMNVGG
jgi:hypothetical protein